MLSGPGYSESYPNDVDSPQYLTWALAQTQIEHFENANEALNGLHDHLRTSGLRYGRRLHPFAETVTLDLLSVDASGLDPNAHQKNQPSGDDQILMIASGHRGLNYPSLGDVLGACGYAVTVASQDKRNERDLFVVNPGIAYLRKSTGAFDESDENPGFSLAVVGQEAPNMDQSDSVVDRFGKIIYAADEKLRGLLRVIRPAGRLLIACDGHVRQVRELLGGNPELTEEVKEEFDMAYLKAYGTKSGRPIGKAPLMVFERRS
jgi:hypothetical protein